MEVSAAEQVVKRKRNIGKTKSNVNKSKKKMKMMSMEGNREKKKDFQLNKKMQKLYKKRARDYNSDNDDDDDDDDDDVDQANKGGRFNVFPRKDGNEDEDPEIDLSDDDDDQEEKDEDEDEDEVEPGIMKFTEGCRAFQLAFKSVIKKSVKDDVLGPVLSAHKKLIAEKLAEEETERKVKGDAKKEKHLVSEKGHVKPLEYLDAHEKFLIGVATKGVVKLFNAVNKAQHAQKGLNPDRLKDAKVLRKRRNQAFFSELGKAPRHGADSTAKDSGEGPSWAPLRDNYMLTSSKLKNWDKMPDAAVTDDIGRISEGDSSDED